MKKRLLAALLSASVMLTSMSNTVFAETKVTSVPDYPMGEYNLILPEIICENGNGINEDLVTDPYLTYSNSGVNTYNYYDWLTAAEKECYKDISSALESNPGATECVVYSDDWSAITRAYWAVVNDYPEYIALGSVSGRISSGKCTLGFILEDEYTGETAKAAYDAVMRETYNILVNASSYSTNYEKLKYFAHYLCDNVQYDRTAADTGVGDNSWNAYGSLINGMGVCESYAEAFKLLCDSIHVPCITVISSNHKWNQVYMAGQWYIVDVTWMDAYERTGFYDDDWFMIGSQSAASLDSSVAHQLCYWKELTHPLPYSSDYSVSAGEETYDEAIKDQMILDFIERLYINMLGRYSDQVGKAHWYYYLKNGTSAATAASGFVLSDEIKNSNLSNEEFVTRMYRTFLNREPDSVGMACWLKALDVGCSYGYILNNFAVSEEFADISNSYGIVPGTYESEEYRDVSINLTSFISRMYTKALGRNYDVDGLNYWTGKYVTNTMEIEDIARGFITSDEFIGRNLTDEEFVTCMYSTFFDREPDPSGFAYWMRIMENGGTREDVLEGFLSADEFNDLVESFEL